MHRDNLAASLHRLGYKVDDAEANELFDAVDVERTGVLKRTELTASLLDWKSVQDTYKDRWIASVRHIFSELDKDKDGALDAEEIAAAFSGHLCEYEVDAAVHEALIEAVGVPDGTEDGTADGGVKSGDTRRIDFDSFVRLLQTGSVLDDLRLYDDRLSNHTSRRNSGNLDDFERARKGVKRGGGFLCCLGG